MNGQGQLGVNTLEWLLEPENPGVRYLAIRDLLDKSDNDPELIEARHEAHTQGPIKLVLDNMQPQGYWEKAGPGYTVKYRSAVWALILLAQLGAVAAEDERITRACDYLMEHALSAGGQFGIHGTPSSTIDCLQGNLCWALLELGYDEQRLDKAFEWMVRTVTGEGMAPKDDKEAARRYYAYNCGPNFACGANGNQACAWGATKVMMALGKHPEGRHSPLIKEAIQQGVDFFLSNDPTQADWPTRLGDKPSRNWWKFGFPVFYVTDLLQVVEALTALGYGNDPRLKNTLELIQQKQDAHGRWPLEYDYTGKTWGNYGAKKQANKWVTLRAMRVLKRAGG